MSGIKAEKRGVGLYFSRYILSSLRKGEYWRIQVNDRDMANGSVFFTNRPQCQTFQTPYSIVQTTK
jgi:hypothetical protein